jgi:hypothetical protein
VGDAEELDELDEVDDVEELDDLDEVDDVEELDDLDEVVDVEELAESDDSESSDASEDPDSSDTSANRPRSVPTTAAPESQSPPFNLRVCPLNRHRVWCLIVFILSLTDCANSAILARLSKYCCELIVDFPGAEGSAISA